MGLLSPVCAIVKDFRRTVIVAESSRTSPRQWHSASAAWPSAIESIVAPFFLSLRYLLDDSTVGPHPIPEPINVVESTSPTYPCPIRSRTYATDGAERACNPATARTPFFFARAARFSASLRPLPTGH